MIAYEPIHQLSRGAKCVTFPMIFIGMMQCCGCVHPSPPLVVSDPDPTVKIPAILKEVSEKDLSERAQLVKDLDSDDPAVRFYSIGALERLTGETFGYVYYQDDAQRRPSLLRWRNWLEKQSMGAPSTAASPAS